MQNWKIIENTPYEVNEFGDVRKILKDPRKRCGEYKYLSGSIYNNGYIYYSIDGKRISKHRLIAQYFIPNPSNKPQVNHIDGNKLNNDISNLEWVTPQENARHSWDIGLSKKSEYRITQVIKAIQKQTIDLETGVIYDSLKEACEAVNYNINTARVRIHKQLPIRFQYL